MAGNYTSHFAIFGAVCAGYLALVMGTKLLSLGFRVIRRSFAVDLTKHGPWADHADKQTGENGNQNNQNGRKQTSSTSIEQNQVLTQLRLTLLFILGSLFHTLVVVAACVWVLALAEKGMHVLLVSRNPQKLFAVADEIHRCCNSEVRLLWTDFEKIDAYQNIQEELSKLDIGILVNSVGVSYNKFPEYFCEGDDFEEKSQDMINVNVMSYVMMTNLVLPGMLKRKRGIIINIGSAVGLRPVPFYSLCSATKAFVHFFTAALNMEYSSQGISCQLVIPNMMNTGKPKAPKILWSHPYPDVYVRQAIQTIGREPTSVVHWPHEIEQMISTHFLTNHMLKHMMLKQIKRRVKFTQRGNMSRPSAEYIGIAFPEVI